jgi:hypothetical protein
MTGAQYIESEMRKAGRLKPGEMMESKASVSEAGIFETRRLAELKKKFHMPRGLILSSGETSDGIQDRLDRRDVDQCLQIGNAVFKNSKTCHVAQGASDEKPFGLTVRY